MKAEYKIHSSKVPEAVRQLLSAARTIQQGQLCFRNGQLYGYMKDSDAPITFKHDMGAAWWLNKRQISFVEKLKTLKELKKLPSRLTFYRVNVYAGAPGDITFA